jgi:hypothetical protein
VSSLGQEFKGFLKAKETVDSVITEIYALVTYGFIHITFNFEIHALALYDYVT